MLLLLYITTWHDVSFQSPFILYTTLHALTYWERLAHLTIMLERTRYSHSPPVLSGMTKMKVFNSDYIRNKSDMSCEGNGVPGSFRWNTRICISHVHTPIFSRFGLRKKCIVFLYTFIYSHFFIFRFMKMKEDHYSIKQLTGPSKLVFGELCLLNIRSIISWLSLIF